MGVADGVTVGVVDGVTVGVADGAAVGAADGVVNGSGVFGTMSTAPAASAGNSKVFDGSLYLVNVIDIIAFAHERKWYVALS